MRVSRDLLGCAYSHLSSLCAVYVFARTVQPGCRLSLPHQGPALREWSFHSNTVCILGSLWSAEVDLFTTEESIHWGAEMAPKSSMSSAMGVATEGLGLQLTGYSNYARHIILSPRARQLANSMKTDGICFPSGVNEDPVTFPVITILEFHQSVIDKGRSPSMLKVYVSVTGTKKL